MGFNYYASSRHLYYKLAEDYKLPSIKNLQNTITSKANKMSISTCLAFIFNDLENSKKQCFILIDEIYLKHSLLHHGGQLFGKAECDQSMLAKAGLGIMVECLLDGSRLLFKMILYFLR